MPDCRMEQISEGKPTWNMDRCQSAIVRGVAQVLAVDMYHVLFGYNDT